MGPGGRRQGRLGLGTGAAWQGGMGHGICGSPPLLLPFSQYAWHTAGPPHLFHELMVLKRNRAQGSFRQPGREKFQPYQKLIVGHLWTDEWIKYDVYIQWNII